MSSTKRYSFKLLLYCMACHLMCGFNVFLCYFAYRDDVVMKTAIGVLGDLADTLGSHAGSLIQQSLSSKDFLNECLSSEDDMIKESAEWAKLAISRAISV